MAETKRMAEQANKMGQDAFEQAKRIGEETAAQGRRAGSPNCIKSWPAMPSNQLRTPQGVP